MGVTKNGKTMAAGALFAVALLLPFVLSLSSWTITNNQKRWILIALCLALFAGITFDIIARRDAKGAATLNGH